MTRARRSRQAETEVDRGHMARCLELAERYRGRTAPNPIVGCVIVDRTGKVIAEGAHEGPGTAHGEIAALNQLAGKAPGATLYVNLEPCNHHGRTPPCAPVVRDAGVARVVVGIEDPIDDHRGGIAVLRRAKVPVTVGVLREECERANRPFLTWALLHRPAFTLKAAITLDGKIATVAGRSKWITGDAARADVMRLRDTHDAVLVGIGTVLADDPWLTARRQGGRNPIRVVVDSRLRTPPEANVLRGQHGPRTIVACGGDAPAAREAALVARGAEVWRLRTHASGRVDLSALAHRLGKAGITSVLVEGGGEIHAYMLERGLADEIVIYLAPKVVGGPAKSWVGGKGLASLTAAHRFVFDSDPVRLDGDLRLRFVPAPIPVRPMPPDIDD
ncbi:MAG: bifunctional diaminohydroxyphosphoribosylaminopyrimidine deaminase/5-amino-6-(5-phosphoribosylamino)uracil reductase RibD [Deltaproteobacteria bacterium]|nr:MAG: bifunctional diaminohydroxyphosphoribosylaminopyrimidine deaminase/5-amino-6-(5-phosphoribosylamino)uracil reductase RibD [Deltaproteobacteria bacterium]